MMSKIKFMFYILERDKDGGLKEVWESDLYKILTEHKGSYAYYTKIRGYKQVDNVEQPKGRHLLFNIQEIHGYGWKSG